MSRIGTMRIRTATGNKDVRIYSLDDTNVAWKGLRVQTPAGIGCVNAVNDGTQDTGLTIQASGGIRRIKTYCYTYMADVIQQTNYPAWNWGPTETIYFNGYEYYCGPAIFTTPLSRTFNGKFGMALDTNSTGYNNYTWYLHVYSNGWINTGKTVVIPSATGYGSMVYFEGDLPQEYGTITKFAFLPMSPNGSWTWWLDIPYEKHRVNTLHYY